MKQLLDLSQEYILEGNFISDSVQTEKGYKPDWVDDKNKTVNGRNIITTVMVMIPLYDREGYITSTFQKMYIPKDDIIKLAKKIEEVESIKLVGTIGDDLPF